MKKSFLLASLLFLSFSFCTQTFSQQIYFEQNSDNDEIVSRGDFGFGIGLDYGGLLGGRISFVPMPHIGIFASAGYHLVDFGWQVGANVYLLPKTSANKFRPFFKAMYGSNRVIFIDGADHYNKNYYGFTPGLGIEMRFGSKGNNGLNLNLNTPISSAEFKEDYEIVENDPTIEITQDKLPFAISIGYHFEF